MKRDVTEYQVRKCQRSDCGLRYPYLDHYTFGERCPRCRGETRLVFQGSLLADGDGKEVQAVGEPISIAQASPRMEALLDNVRSAWNVGSMFRTADGAGLAQLYLCGITPNPADQPGVGKTSLGAEKNIPWQHILDGVEMAGRLLQSGRQLWALETSENAEMLYEVRMAAEGRPVVLVVGNEVCGVDPGILALCQRTIQLPMRGMKRSYNVAIAFGIAAHYLSWSHP